MRLLTTQEFSSMLSIAYNSRSCGATLGETLYVEALTRGDKNVIELMNHARDNMYDYLLTWENDLALIKYFIDNFVEEF